MVVSARIPDVIFLDVATCDVVAGGTGPEVVDVGQTELLGGSEVPGLGLGVRAFVGDGDHVAVDGLFQKGEVGAVPGAKSECAVGAVAAPAAKLLVIVVPGPVALVRGIPADRGVAVDSSDLKPPEEAAVLLHGLDGQEHEVEGVGLACEQDVDIDTLDVDVLHVDNNTLLSRRPSFFLGHAHDAGWGGRTWTFRGMVTRTK